MGGVPASWGRAGQGSIDCKRGPVAASALCWQQQGVPCILSVGMLCSCVAACPDNFPWLCAARTRPIACAAEEGDGQGGGGAYT